MAVFFVVNIEISNPNDRTNYDEYIKKVKPIVESFGGNYIIRSEQVTLFAGDLKPDRIIVIAFEKREALYACFSSNEYRAVKGLREMSVKTSAFIVEQA